MSTAPVSRRHRRVRPVLLITAGVLLLLTPVVLTHLKNTEQQRLAAEYTRRTAQLDRGQRESALAAAHAYNARLGDGGIADPWSHVIDTASLAYRHYQTLLDLDSVMARLRIPSVGIDLPVRHGTSQGTLAVGVGHLFGTALPVGGLGTHTVLTGHTGLATLTMFDNLTHVKVGDIFLIDVMGETLAYQVDQTKTVLPTGVEDVRPVVGKDYATLVTCTPYGINSHRLLVRGTRVPVPTMLPPQTYHSPWQTWMFAAIVISLAALLYLFWWLLAAQRLRKDTGKPAVETPVMEVRA